jgi:biopolymer transport protein TolR
MSRFYDSDNEPDALFAEINITPFTDVVLVLLIIFMVTAPMMVESRIPIKLPVTTQPALSPEQHPTVVVTADGRIYLNDRPVANPAALVGALRGEMLRSQDHTVVFKADAAVRHGRVIECLDAAKSAGADRLAISARPGRVEPPAPGR